MRAGRLVALLLHIQRHGGAATAPDLARTMEVSARTIYRDVAALQAAGVPLWTAPGRDGGIRLMDGWKFPLDGFSSEESAALLVGASGAADLGLGAVLTAAQSKVVTALPRELRGRAERVRQRFHLDAPGWFRQPDEASHLPAIAEAVWGDCRIEIGYLRAERDGDREVKRQLSPLGLVMKAGTWYLVAAATGTPRTYRVSRVTEVAMLDEPVDRPEGFELEEWWASSSGAFDSSIRPLNARLRLSQAAQRRLPHVVPGPATSAALEEATAPDEDGQVVLTLPLEPLPVAVSQLVQLPGLEVLDPPDLRSAVAEHCANLAAVNADR